MKFATDIQHRIIYKDAFCYCAHPHIKKLADGSWLLVFNRTIRRNILLHPPEDPHYYNMMMRSSDQGFTWTTPRVVPGYDWYGVECAGLTSLTNGTVLLNQWRFRWFPLETARKLINTDTLTFPEEWGKTMKQAGEINETVEFTGDLGELFPWARSNGGAYVHRSKDFGQTWEDPVEINTHPFSGGYGLRGALEMPNGDVVLPLSDVPNYKAVFVIRSEDGGQSWGTPIQVAYSKNLWFEEPTALLLSDNRILMLLRENSTHHLYQTISCDGGWTWSPPIQTPIWGYPADLLLLPDDIILCVYGYRKNPYGIRAVMSFDQGATWDDKNTLILRDDLPNRDLGYPSSVLMTDGRVFSVYYGQDFDGVTCIQSTSFPLG